VVATHHEPLTPNDAILSTTQSEGATVVVRRLSDKICLPSTLERFRVLPLKS
jgi:hypothetical protein